MRFLLQFGGFKILYHFMMCCFKAHRTLSCPMARGPEMGWSRKLIEEIGLHLEANPAAFRQRQEGNLLLQLVVWRHGFQMICLRNAGHDESPIQNQLDQMKGSWHCRTYSWQDAQLGVLCRFLK